MKNFNEICLNLQIFADAGTLTNVAYGKDSSGLNTYQTNSYNGEGYTVDSHNKFDVQLKDYLDTKMLENYRMKQVYMQLAKRQNLPAHHGTRIEFRKWNTFARAGKLIDGVIPTGQKWGSTAKYANIDQYGTYVTLSDKLQRHAYDDVQAGAYTEMGASAAETEETLCRDALAINTNVMYCDNVAADGTIKSTPGTPGEMKWSETDGYCKLTPTMINKARTKMVKDKVEPMADGKYVMVIHPSVAFDLREDQHWIDVHKYAGVKEIYNGEIGELHGFRFIENPDAPVIALATNKKYYYTYAFGKEPFIGIDAEGGALQMITHDMHEIGGPLDQFSTIGYKLDTNGATVLYPERVLRLVSLSSFSATDVANATV